MTTPDPVCVDPALDIISAVITACEDIYDPAGQCPPAGLETAPTVRFFAWAGAPLAAWDSFLASSEDACSQPFIWVRSDQRFRTSNFPEEESVIDPCKGQGVICLEIGVGRCAFQPTAEIDWSVVAEQTGISIDDSWRIDRIMCLAGSRLNKLGFSVASNTIVPYGPEGGLSAWSGMIYVGY